MSNLRDLAARLRRLRLRHGLTQEQFAEAAGLSYKFYQQIETGRKKQVWLETIERLAAGFGLQAWQLLAPDEPAHTTVRAAARGEPRPADELAVAEEQAEYVARRPGKKPAAKGRVRRKK